MCLHIIRCAAPNRWNVVNCLKNLFVQLTSEWHSLCALEIWSRFMIIHMLAHAIINTYFTRDEIAAALGVHKCPDHVPYSLILLWSFSFGIGFARRCKCIYALVRCNVGAAIPRRTKCDIINAIEKHGIVEIPCSPIPNSVHFRIRKSHCICYSLCMQCIVCSASAGINCGIKHLDSQHKWFCLAGTAFKQAHRRLTERLLVSACQPPPRRIFMGKPRSALLHTLVSGGCSTATDQTTTTSHYRTTECSPPVLDTQAKNGMHEGRGLNALYCSTLTVGFVISLHSMMLCNMFFPSFLHKQIVILGLARACQPSAISALVYSFLFFVYVDRGAADTEQNTKNKWLVPAWDIAEAHNGPTTRLSVPTDESGLIFVHFAFGLAPIAMDILWSAFTLFLSNNQQQLNIWKKEDEQQNVTFCLITLYYFRSYSIFYSQWSRTKCFVVSHNTHTHWTRCWQPVQKEQTWFHLFGKWNLLFVNYGFLCGMHVAKCYPDVCECGAKMRNLFDYLFITLVRLSLDSFAVSGGCILSHLFCSSTTVLHKHVVNG